MKTEILVQMDGLARGKELVFVLAATNMPWELDMAMLRRLEKRIMVPLPEAEGRQAMLESLLGDRVALGVDLADVAARTEGFSGADMYLLAKEAAMRPLRCVRAPGKSQPWGWRKRRKIFVTCRRLMGFPRSCPSMSWS